MYYGISSWWVAPNEQVDRVQRMQNWGVRLIDGRSKYDHVSDLIVDYRFLTVRQTAQHGLTVMAYKAAQGLLGAI
jgi:hypothetical protein